MTLFDCLFFVDDSYALPAACVRGVMALGSHGCTESPLGLRDLGLAREGDVSKPSGRVVLIDTGETVISLLICGQLESRAVDGRLVVPLPSTFFGASPFQALIVRPSTRPSLLISPERLNIQLDKTNSNQLEPSH